MAILAGLLLGAALVVLLFARGKAPFVEREEYRPLATDAEIEEWTGELKRRGIPWTRVPDPPGVGPVVRERYWLSRAVYAMEVRRRGRRVVVEIHGVDVQTMGGGWASFGEGTITGDPTSFAGAEARIAWSCMGIRFRASSDGLAKLSFSEDGSRVAAVYFSWEAPELIAKAYGERIRDSSLPRPPYGSYRGQIPVTEALPRHAPEDVVKVAGRVVSTEGVPIADALVQLKGRNRTRIHADEQGRFHFDFRGRDAPWGQAICAGAVGYRNGEAALFTGDPTDDVVVELAPVDLSDHPSYAWVNPDPTHDPDDAMSCGTCHSWQYTEWLGSRHARSADHGHVSFERDRMRQEAPDAPDDCAGCHQPAFAASTGRGDYAPRGPMAGNHCDFCHKLRHTEDVGKPGVLGSLALARPDPSLLDRPGAIQHVFGASPDVTYAYMGASYDPYVSTSWLCAGCHQGGGLAGRPKVDTFEEWRAWASTREDERFRECQDCHMPTGTTVAAEGWKVGQFAWDALHREPSGLHSHAFPGITRALVRPALSVEVAKAWDEATGSWAVDVSVASKDVGHKVPTGTWTKHVLVGVWARQGDAWLVAAEGPRAVVDPSLPAPAAPLEGGDWRNAPGIVLGVFRKGGPAASGGAPASFWAPPAETDVEDTRLSPGETRTFRVRFSPRASGRGEPPTVEVRVLHRRGAIGSGPERTPWPLRPADPAPQVEWIRVTR